MGVPKFYRWLSERYPCINENVNQFNMPEFDNFYVDMNGVFHICSHPSDDVHFRIPEKQIFENIGTYVNFLFHLVQPRKVFFLSVDGVAPRSKMNQQRSRRFKSAKEAIEKENKAKQMGESLPDDPRFDSNCITPGTEFMNKLHLFMIDFLGRKIQLEQEWKEVEVIYSGYDVPGEGEHKIMDYIRYCKTQNLFDPDTRHCLYGLDADLINLGLSTHEPYFSILREEVSFGRNRQKHCDPIRTNFQLLHISLLRNYIYHEFKELESKMKFKFDLEKIIDDWILINFLVGNDFLPHVPRLHINKNGIQILYDSYKTILPLLDGYLNMNGTLNLKRYQKFLQKLSEHDLNLFNNSNGMDGFQFLEIDNDITFGTGVDLNEDFDFELNNQELINEENDTTTNSEDDDDLDSEDLTEDDEDEDEEEDELLDEFKMHKNNYYISKLNFKPEDLTKDVQKIVEEYIKGIQWVLHYYFDGCISWNWYYPYHYGPFLSDLAKIDINFEFKFEMSQPFLPLVQLLAVLPQASKEILPKAFQELTFSTISPLIEYFPKEFKTDLNEKLHDYEAIILIPFMDDKLLMDTFEKYKHLLTTDELQRNKFGVHHLLKYQEEPIQDPQEALDLEKYPNVHDQKISLNFYILPKEIIYKGLRKNINLNSINGFPSFNGIDYQIKMDQARIKVFDFPTQNQSMLILIEKKSFTPELLTQLAENFIDKIIYINWPLLFESKLIELIDNEFKYQKHRKDTLSPEELRSAEISARNYGLLMKNKKGIILQEIECMVKVLPLQSQRYIITGGKVKLHKEWSTIPIYVPIDIVIFDTKDTYRQLPLYKSLNKVFTKNKSYYLIANPYYGYKADIIKYINKENLIMSYVTIMSEPDFSEIELEYSYIMRENYYTEGKLSMIVKRQLNLQENIIRRLLGSVLTQYETNKGRVKRFNIGLKLKYKNNFQQYCIPGYSCVNDNELFYNKKVVQIFLDYYKKFPQVFEMLMRENKSSYDLEDLFPDEDEQNEFNGDDDDQDQEDTGMCKSEKIKALQDIRDWIESQNFSKINHTLGSAEYLDTCIVEAMEERIASHMVLLNEEKTITRKFPPSSFYIPEFILKGNYLPDPKVKFLPFDRVVNIKTCISPPFGLKGTVIGIYYGNDLLNKSYRDQQQQQQQITEFSELILGTDQDNNNDNNQETLLSSTIEVLFDEQFDGGLLGRSKKPNVFKMHASWLINISYGMRIAAATNQKSKTNFKNIYQSIQPVRSQSNHHFNTNHGNTNNFNISNHHQQQHNYHQDSPQKIRQHQQQLVVQQQRQQPNDNDDSDLMKFTHSENSPFKILKKPPPPPSPTAATTAISFADIVSSGAKTIIDAATTAAANAASSAASATATDDNNIIPKIQALSLVLQQQQPPPLSLINFHLNNNSFWSNDNQNSFNNESKDKIFTQLNELFGKNLKTNTPEKPITSSPSSSGLTTAATTSTPAATTSKTPPAPPVEWILMSKQKQSSGSKDKKHIKTINFSPENPIPSFTILPSGNTKDKNKTLSPPISPKNEQLPIIASLFCQAATTSTPSPNRNQKPSPQQQQMTPEHHHQHHQQQYRKHHHHHQHNRSYHQQHQHRRNQDQQQQQQRQEDENLEYQQPLSNNKIDTTRFVPLVVARNHQHENVLRRHHQHK